MRRHHGRWQATCIFSESAAKELNYYYGLGDNWENLTNGTASQPLPRVSPIHNTDDQREKRLGPNPAFAIVRFAVNPSVVRVRRGDVVASTASAMPKERTNERTRRPAAAFATTAATRPTTERPRPFPFVRPKAARLRSHVSFVHITSRHENASVLPCCHFFCLTLEVIISPHEGLLISFG